MEKEKITGEAQSLYNDIDKCIDKILSARTQHDPQLEGKALFQMEGLMVCTQQFLAWLMEHIEDSANIEKELDESEKDKKIVNLHCRIKI